MGLLKGRALIHVGTSGWHYEHWLGPFYPRETSKEHLLEYYIRHFRTVEINSSFYRLPDRRTLTVWREITPKDFIFASKASRYITHMKKLKDPKEPFQLFWDTIRNLKNKLGPILFQLPPRWNINLERLENCLESLPTKGRYTFEFRDDSWFCDQTYEVLSKHDAAFCIYDLDGRLSPQEVTADFVYVRLHGPNGPYRGQYARKVLAEWTDKFFDWTSQNKKVYCYLDNDEAGYAAQDALKLQEMIQER